MGMSAHMEGRSRFYFVVHEVLVAGSKRWAAQTRRRGGLATFLKEECDDANYKLFRGLQAAASGDGRGVWIKKADTFDQFMKRLREADIRQAASRQPLYFGEEALARLESEFRTFWTVESVWVAQYDEEGELLKLFRSANGPALIDGAIRGGETDVQALYDASCNAVETHYRNNEYVVGQQLSDAFALGFLKTVENEEDKERRELIVYYLTDVIRFNILARLGVRAAEPGRYFDAYGLRISGNRFLARHAVSMSYIYFKPHRLSQGINESDRTEVLIKCNITRMWLFQREAGLRTGAADEDDVIVSFMEDFVNWREIYASLYGSLSDEEEFVRLHDASSPGSTMPPYMVEDIRDTVECLNAPEVALERMWNYFQADNARGRYSECARLMAKRWLSPLSGDMDKACMWLAKLVDVLMKNQMYLAWEDAYALMQQYWEKRGNTVLVDRCIEGRVALLKAASGSGDTGKINSDIGKYSDDLENQRRRLMDNPLASTGPVRGDHEVKLRQLLMDVPPPLKRKPRR